MGIFCFWLSSIRIWRNRDGGLPSSGVLSMCSKQPTTQLVLRRRTTSVSTILRRHLKWEKSWTVRTWQTPHKMLQWQTEVTEQSWKLQRLNNYCQKLIFFKFPSPIIMQSIEVDLPWAPAVAACPVPAMLLMAVVIPRLTIWDAILIEKLTFLSQIYRKNQSVTEWSELRSKGCKNMTILNVQPLKESVLKPKLV